MWRLLVALVIATLFVVSASVLHLISVTYAAGVATGLLLSILPTGKKSKNK